MSFFRRPWVPAALLAAALLIGGLRAATTSYPDVKASGEWWSSTPALARGLGIARGFPSGESRCTEPRSGDQTFCPETSATRAEATAMAVRGVTPAVLLSGLLAWLIATLMVRGAISQLRKEMGRIAPATTPVTGPAAPGGGVTIMVNVENHVTTSLWARTPGGVFYPTTSDVFQRR